MSVCKGRKIRANRMHAVKRTNKTNQGSDYDLFISKTQYIYST